MSLPAHEWAAVGSFPPLKELAADLSAEEVEFSLQKLSVISTVVAPNYLAQ